jgi:hypothetical protein
MPRNAAAVDKRRFEVLIAEFRKAAEGNLDDDEKLLMQRVAESDEAPTIFAKIKDDKIAKRLLSLCFEAHFLAKNFNKLTSDARRALDREAMYKRSIANIERLLKDTQKPALNRLTAYTMPDANRIALEREALQSMKDRLDVQSRTAKETILRVGATRKSRGKRAAETAAIGWIAEGVKRITKKTNARLSADLAELILGCDVSLDRIDNAADTRKREWRRN